MQTKKSGKASGTTAGKGKAGGKRKPTMYEKWLAGEGPLSMLEEKQGKYVAAIAGVEQSFYCAHAAMDALLRESTILRETEELQSAYDDALKFIVEARDRVNPLLRKLMAQHGRFLHAAAMFQGGHRDALVFDGHSALRHVTVLSDAPYIAGDDVPVSEMHAGGRHRVFIPTPRPAARGGDAAPAPVKSDDPKADR